MLPPTTTAATYTTIPISTTDVISRSTQNLSTCISRRRPWSELLTNIDLPASVSDAATRFRRNGSYFSINYSIVIAICALASLVGSPIALILLGFVFFLWLIFHFFREDPLFVLGKQVSNLTVILVLVVISFLALWVTGPLNSLSAGISVGLVSCVIHGVLRNEEGVFLDENDAALSGLIVSGNAGSRTGGIAFRAPV